MVTHAVDKSGLHADKPKQPIKSILISLARLVFVGILFFVVFRQIHPRDVLEAWKTVKPLNITVALILMIPNILLQVAKWYCLLRSLDPRPSFGDAFYSLMGGLFFAAASPARMGELARGACLPGQSLVRTGALTVIEKAAGHFFIFIGGLCSLFFLVSHPVRFLLPVIIMMTLLLPYSLYHSRHWWKRIIHRYLHRDLADHAHVVFASLKPRRLMELSFYSLLLYLVFTFQFYLILKGFIDFPLRVAFLTIPVVFFMDLVMPVSLGGFGIKEFTSVQLMIRYGLDGGAVLGASLTHNIMTLIVPGVIGGIMFALAGLRRNRGVQSSDGSTAHEHGSSSK